VIEKSIVKFLSKLFLNDQKLTDSYVS